MSWLSEDSFRARWMENVEYLLWSAVTGNTEGMRWKLKDEDTARLRELSERCGGWIIHDGDVQWIPLEVWKERYAKHQAERTRLIEGRLYSNEEFQAEVEMRRRKLLEVRQGSEVTRRDLAEAVADFFDALFLESQTKRE
jgi:hypothetical protein